MKEIVAVIDEAGNIEVEAKGFKGAGCAKAVEELLAKAGRKTGERHKPEYNAQETVKAGTGK